MNTKNKRPFRWTNAMHTALVESLSGYKTKMEFNGIDFDWDRASQCKSVRVALAKLFIDDPESFGPEQIAKAEFNRYDRGN